MRQGFTGAARGLNVPPRRRSVLAYPSRRRHGVLVSLFPRNYGRFLLIGLAGKAIFLFALACGFVIAAAVAAGRPDLAFAFAIPMAGIGCAVYELLAHWRVTLLNRTLRPIQPAGVALLVLALSGVWFLAIPFGSGFIPHF